MLVLASIIGVVSFILIERTKLYSQLKTNSFQEEILTNVNSSNFKTASGLQYRVINEGKGIKKPNLTSKVTVHYIGKLENGVEFDSSYSRQKPASFPVNGVIPGWTEALQLMSIGDKWEITIPPELGYGSHGAGNVIPPDATLIFEVELIDID